MKNQGDCKSLEELTALPIFLKVTNGFLLFY